MAFMKAEGLKPRQRAIGLQSVATSQTMNSVMACKVGVESMSKGVCPSVEGLRPSVGVIGITHLCAVVAMFSVK